MSCDAELHELMIQVDKMVEEKKSEWQDKIKLTENKLHNTLQENYNMRSVIDDRNIEIESLRNKIKTRDSISSVTEYDEEVLQLRLELSQIKKSYEKYHYKYLKRSKVIEKEKEELYLEKIELLKQINEFKNQQSHWSHERSSLQMQIEELESRKNEVFSDKTMLLEQLKTLKFDFSRQLESFSESEKTYNTNLRELENKLHDSKSCLQQEISTNRSKLCELMQHAKTTVEEKQKVIIDNESAKRMIIRLENELGKVISDNKVKDKTVFKLEQSMRMSEKAINEKNEVIKALQLNSSSKDHSPLISKLENELLEAKSSIKLSKKKEKSLQYEILSLDLKLKETQEWIDSENKNKKQMENSVSQLSKLEEDKSKLTKQIEKLEEFIETKSSEMNDTKDQFEYLRSENELLKERLHQELKKNEDNNLDKRDYKNRMDNPINQWSEQRSIYTTDKERNDLLKVCENKDLLIHRLQMENRILQEFITKLNVGLSEDVSYIPVGTHFGDGSSTSDIFQPLKETFMEYNDSTLSVFNQPTHQINSELSMIDVNNQSQPQPSDAASPKSNCRSHERKDHNCCRSSEDFLCLLSQKEGHSRGLHDRSSFMNIYPTLTAAKYFTEEREKTKQIEEIIDQHMSQLRLETDRRCNTNNQ